MSIIKEIIENQTIIANLYHEYGGDKETYEMLWTAVVNNDKDQSVTLLNFVLMDLSNLAHDLKHTNDLQKILNIVDFKSQMQEDLARGKRKVSSLSDIMAKEDPLEKLKEEVKPTNILDI